MNHQEGTIYMSLEDWDSFQRISLLFSLLIQPSLLFKFVKKCGTYFMKKIIWNHWFHFWFIDYWIIQTILLNNSLFIFQLLSYSIDVFNKKIDNIFLFIRFEISVSVPKGRPRNYLWINVDTKRNCLIQ